MLASQAHPGMAQVTVLNVTSVLKRGGAVGWGDSSEAQLPVGQVQGREFEPRSRKKKKKEY